MRWIVAMVVVLAATTAVHAQQVLPVQPATVYAMGWQPVMVPGQLVAVPRPLYVTNWLWGPRVYFVPQLQQPPAAQPASVPSR